MSYLLFAYMPDLTFYLHHWEVWIPWSKVNEICWKKAFKTCQDKVIYQVFDNMQKRKPDSIICGT